MANRSFLTLLLVLAIAHFAPVALPGANALQGMNLTPPVAVKRTEHNQMAGRMIKRRLAARASATETGTGSSDTAAASGNSQTGTGTSSPSGQSNTSTTPTSTTPTQTPTNTNTNTNTSTSTTPSSSTTPTSTSTTPATSAPPNTSAPTSTPPTSTRRSTLTQTQTSAAASQTTSQAADPDSSFLPKPAIIGLIVTGSCIAAAAAIWTIIRKWKFSPSRHFEDRLEPINWEPTQSSGLPHDPTVAALARAGSGSRTGRNRGSLSSDEQGSVKNMSSVNNDQVSMAPDFPPPHDFTAGAANLGAPTGYVDMYRGPSPGPNAYAQRGPSPAPGGPYGQQYQNPNPYDAYDYNAGYGQPRHY